MDCCLQRRQILVLDQLLPFSFPPLSLALYFSISQVSPWMTPWQWRCCTKLVSPTHGRYLKNAAKGTVLLCN